MQLSVKDLAKLLNVSESKIFGWIKAESIPFYKIHQRYMFNRVEILEWASARKIKFSGEILGSDLKSGLPEISLAEAVKKGGIHYNVEGKNKNQLLNSALNLIKLPGSINKKDLLNALLAREELASTGFGGGIAVPHARYPIVTRMAEAVVSICFLKEAVDFGAVDGKPVNCLFTLISPNVRSHLKLLSKIVFVLSDDEVKKAVSNQSVSDVIINAISIAETNS